MNKLSLIVAGAVIAGFVGFTGTASAEPEPEGNAFGFYGCDSPSAPGSANPGDWFKTLKASDTLWDGLNPAQIAAEYSDRFDANVTSVGDLIAKYCGQPD